ncbi:MAG: gamma carbonic anhydrase family protein [Alphaproteobacteria bacterium]|nr:gamma carbonic anhydrase family protein [Alphaproteobacteria bacterium]
MEPLIYAIGDKKPVIHPSAFIAPGVVICGDVEVHEDASVWYGSVLRGDTNKIIVGKGSNVQDGTVIHVDAPQWGGLPTIIGANALIGHKCMLHGATVEDGGFVGMCATMLDGSVVETGAMLAAGAFLSPKKRVPAGEMWAGMPARKMRDMREGEAQMALMGAAHYVEEARSHRNAMENL